MYGLLQVSKPHNYPIYSALYIFLNRILNIWCVCVVDMYTEDSWICESAHCNQLSVKKDENILQLYFPIKQIDVS